MDEFLAGVRKRTPIALVGGSDMGKIVEQMGDSIQEGKT